MAIISMGMIDYKTFRRFLQVSGCEAAFDRAFYNHNGFTHLDEALWETGDAEYIFAHAFEWSATPEGREYWLEIDRVWNIKVIKQSDGNN